MSRNKLKIVTIIMKEIIKFHPAISINSKWLVHDISTTNFNLHKYLQFKYCE